MIKVLDSGREVTQTRCVLGLNTSAFLHPGVYMAIGELLGQPYEMLERGGNLTKD